MYISLKSKLISFLIILILGVIGLALMKIRLTDLVLAKESFEEKEVLTTPILNQSQEITPKDGFAVDQFGQSVDIDGNTAIIGSYQDDDNGISSGSAYVYVNNGTTWIQQAKLKPSDGTQGDFFGFAVAVCGDTAIVGAYLDDDTANSSGSAYIFVRNNSTWTQQAKLTADDADLADVFGQNVAISGNIAIVGAVSNDDNGDESGSAYVFVRNSNVWTQEAKLLANDGMAFDSFGQDVGVDGETVVVGANQNSAGGSFSGAAYVFTRSGTNWSLQQKITPSDGMSGDQFGISVGINGNTIVIGASGEDNANGSAAGAIYIFTRSENNWTQQAKLTASDGDLGDNLGFDVDISGDTVIAGAYRDDDNGNISGSAYVYTRTGTNWNEHRKLLVSNGTENDQFGRSVAINNLTAVVGARLRDISENAIKNKVNLNFSNLAGADQGAAYFFNLLAPTSSLANISGKVFTSNRRGISGAIIHLTDQNGIIRTARTNQLGYYKFENIEVGQTLVFNVYSKRYQFETQVVNFADTLTGFDFVAQ